MDRDISQDLQTRVSEAFIKNEAVDIRGGDSKCFVGRVRSGVPLSVTEHRGIVDYAPEELVITARAGTPLRDIEMLLDQHQQMFSFEPPRYGETATLGGVVATGLSGPRRAYAGSVRDCVLGVKLINGQGHLMNFGGRVMKNVAGYDVSRLQTGALGTLGVLLDMSFKVLPKPEQEITLVYDMALEAALKWINELAGQPVPLSASCIHDGKLHLRLSGTQNAINAVKKRLGGDEKVDGPGFWQALKEQQLPFFQKSKSLWRVAVPPAAPHLELSGDWLMEWGGAQRWLVGTSDARRIHQAATSAGGHASLYRGGDREGEVFHPLNESVAVLHKQVKHAFDPKSILNPGRLYQSF